jgi:aminocarboxymuconate-semialdehyde decarboxylase
MSEPVPSRRARVIDFHVHSLEREVFRAATNKTVFTGFGANPVSEPRPGARALLERMFEPAALIEDMDARGIDMSVITSSTVLQGTSWAEPAQDLALCQRCNDQSARWATDHSARLVASAVLPLQAPELALPELERCEAMGIRVLNVSSSYNGVYIGDPVFTAFWAAVERYRFTVWIHPEGVRDPWFQRYGLWNSLGQSIEETRAMASLIYEGVMTRHPALKVVIAHGGGYFPHYMGRVDRNAINRPDSVQHLNGQQPSDLLGRFYYDSCVYDPRVLRVLIDRVGASRIVMGSDYPVGEKDPVNWLRSCGLSGEALDAVAGGNAEHLLFGG